ncbi:uncharacterized protein LOC121744936 [Salvia splendens]|uniref:uncharacterized protein LOC121744936 n=1 Tax=Salvia splendens TaxID=180675 RepID=UPI001C27DE4D|nr:uncharacterized protein LOC121744936 [Salvia splendens]
MVELLFEFLTAPACICRLQVRVRATSDDEEPWPTKTLFRRSKSQKRKRRVGGLITEAMIEAIPAHVKQVDRLVRVSDRSCVDNLRMDRNTFGRLCRILRDRVELFDQKFVTVEEQVAMFLSILSHHKKTRVVGHDFMRSSETVSKYTHVVLRGVLTLHDIFLVKPEPVGDDCTDSRWKCFKVCVISLLGVLYGILMLFQLLTL